jgi:Xaa-Pro aminopeptidase
VYYHFGRDAEFDLKLIGWLNRVRAQVRMGAQPPHEFLELGHLLDEMRLFKSGDELKLMQRAADISVEAHRAAMRAARAGVREFELQAELERVFRAHDAEPRTAASSARAPTPACCTTAPTTPPRARATWCSSTPARNTATMPPTSPAPFPVDGRFNKAQRALHDLVGDAQRAALAKAMPGVAYDAGHQARSKR